MRMTCVGSALGIACLAVSAFAQEFCSPLGCGVKGGVPLSDAFLVKPTNPIQYVADTPRYTFGPYVELRLPAGFGFEVDALYKTYEYRRVVPSFTVDQNSHAWEY